MTYLAFLNTLDSPEMFTVLPGPCDKTYPDVNLLTRADRVVAGKKLNIAIKCRDKYNNTLVKGGDNFVATILGSEVSYVNTDVVLNTIRDYDNGTYEIEFVVAYAGAY